VLTAITGSPFFPGGIGNYRVSANTGLGFEQGPTAAVELQWGTYFDAADQAGLSRIWGGIHPPADDFAGRRVGSQCGQGVWSLAQRYWDGSVTNTPIQFTRLNATDLQRQLCETAGIQLRAVFRRRRHASRRPPRH
jgi:hypothetical protein